MKRFLVRCALTCFVILSASSAQAAAILFPVAGTIDGSVTFLNDNPSTPIYDVRGAATVQVVDETNAPIAAEFLIGSNPFPASSLFLLNLTGTEALDLTFNFGSSIFDPAFPGPNWYVAQVVGTALTAITDPGLAEFIGIDNVAHFTLLTPNGIPVFGENDVVIGTTFNFTLASITSPDATPVPEPATLGLLGTGLVMAVRRRRSRSKKA